MHAQDLQNFAVQAAIAPGPVDRGVTMIVLTNAERDYLLERVADESVGPGASARLKLRAAAPVLDADWGKKRLRGFIGFVSKLFESDGRQRGRCRWCDKRTRIDQYGLCERCVPSKGEDGDDMRPRDRRALTQSGACT
jgi:hypothetical protein